MMGSPTETSANCKRSNFLYSSCFRRKTLTPSEKLCLPPPGNMQSRGATGSLGQVHRPLHQADLPNQLPGGGQGCSHTFSIVHLLSRKRWCAAVTETATRASAKCGDRRAVKGWRWRTTRTAKPQSNQKKSKINIKPQSKLQNNYRTQVSWSDLCVWLSLTDWATLCKLNWCDSSWWGYQLNSNW